MNYLGSYYTQSQKNKIMGYVSKILHMIFFIIFILISFQLTHVIFPGAPFNAASYSMRLEKFQEKHHHIRKLTREKKVFNFEKFTAFLGLKSFKNIKEPNRLPSPLPAPAPAPAPVLPIYVHSPHRSSNLPRVIVPVRKVHKEKRERKKGKKILVAVLVSASVTLVLCGIGLLWGCQKFQKKRRSRSTVSTIHSTEGGGTRSKSNYVVTSQNSVKKVSSNPGPDLFYLDTIESALERQQFSAVKNCPTVKNTFSNQESTYCKLSVVEESENELGKSDSDTADCSDVGEIVSFNESQELVEHVAVGRSYQISEKVKEEDHSSDDESFHSVCNSQSSHARLSNASASTLGDTSEIVSPCVPNVAQVQNSASYPRPPPPPPLPPLIHKHISPADTISSSTSAEPKALSPSTLTILSSPRYSNSSSGSYQTPRGDLAPSPSDSLNSPLEIPPPPCPPPFTKGNGNQVKGPPPPPTPHPQYTPLGKDGVPLPKLKPLHWDKVRAAPDHTMVWDKLSSNSFEFDEEMIESLFGYNLKNSMKNDDTKIETPSPSKHVLEPKRLQNITILSKAINVTAKQVCDALKQGTGLSLQQLEALIKMEPTKEEEAKLANYKGDSNELGSAEKLVKAMLNLPSAFMRIEAMLYKESFQDEVDHLRKSFSMLEEACKELRSSRLFLKLLEAVLKTGNRMNVGTIRGGARAFKLDALLKLADVKGTDGKTTLLHFVVQEIIRAEGIKVSESIFGKINIQKSKGKSVEDREEMYRRMGLDLVSGLAAELFNVKKTATIDIDVIASSVSNLSDGMTKLQHLVSKGLSKEENSGNFVQLIRSFLNYAEKSLKELQEDERRVLLHVREITEYFHGHVSKDEANPLRIFVIVRDFLGMLDHVCKELRSLKEQNSLNPLAPFR